MTQLAPSNQQLPSRPATRPAWMTFCLGLLPLVVTRHDLDAQQSPAKSHASAAEVVAGTSERKRARCVHKVWTRADGFTLSGARRT